MFVIFLRGWWTKRKGIVGGKRGLKRKQVVGVEIVGVWRVGDSWWVAGGMGGMRVGGCIIMVQHMGV